MKKTAGNKYTQQLPNQPPTIGQNNSMMHLSGASMGNVGKSVNLSSISQLQM